MSAFPGYLGGRADDGSPDWFEDLSRQLDRIVGVSAGEARSIASGLRHWSGGRLESAFAALRARLGRTGVGEPGVEAELELRAQIRVFGLERTIEDWPRHAIQPPSIRM